MLRKKRSLRKYLFYFTFFVAIKKVGVLPLPTELCSFGKVALWTQKKRFFAKRLALFFGL
jgi:hypothetical protein